MPGADNIVRSRQLLQERAVLFFRTKGDGGPEAPAQEPEFS